MMKNLLVAIICAGISVHTYAQSGPAIKYSYGAGGFRTKREFLLSTPLLKQGTTADTVVLVSDSSTTTLKQANIFVKSYPNPVHDLLFIEHFFWQDGNSATIKVLDILGKQILEKRTKINKDHVNLEHVAPGTYTVNYFVNSVFLASWKIVKL